MSEETKAEECGNKQYIYSIGYWSCEESEYNYLTHTQYFTSEQIHELVEEAVVTVIKNKIKDDYIHSYQNVHDDVINILVDKEGFNRLKINTSWSVFGWASLFDINDWKKYINYSNKRLVKAVSKAGFTEEDDSFLQQDKKWDK